MVGMAGMAGAGTTTANGRLPLARGRPGPVDLSRPSGEPVDFDLVRPLSAVTWLGTVAGQPVVARAFPADVDDEVRDRSASLLELAGDEHDEHLVPFLGLGQAEGVPWLLSEYLPGASLSRLLTVTTLSVHQAAAVANGLFCGLAAVRDLDAVHGRISARTVHLGGDGVVRLTDWAAGALGTSGLTESSDDQPAVDLRWCADIEAARVIVAELARNADRPVARHGGPQTRLLSRLASIGGQEVMQLATLDSDGLRHLVGQGSDTVNASANARLELASLIAVVTSRLPGERRTAAAGSSVGARSVHPVVAKRAIVERPPDQPGLDPDRPPVLRGLPKAKLSDARWPVRRGRARRWAALTVAALVAVTAALVITGQGRRIVDRIRHHSSTTEPTSAGPAARGRATTQRSAGRRGTAFRAVPVLAPPAAGVVNHVALHAASRCAVGRSCRVRITVHLTPSARARHVTWRVTLVDRCTGRRSTALAGRMLARPGWTSIWTDRQLVARGATGLAAVAMTTAPARAAARPLLVQSSARHC